jgi:hypothetical protein
MIMKKLGLILLLCISVYAQYGDMPMAVTYYGTDKTFQVPNNNVASVEMTNSSQTLSISVNGSEPKEFNFKSVDQIQATYITQDGWLAHSFNGGLLIIKH